MFLLQYSFDLISTCLLNNKASYISIEVKPFNDFTPLLGVSNCISSISVLSFDTIPWWVFDMSLQSCGNEAFILLNSKTNPALYTSFWKWFLRLSVLLLSNHVSLKNQQMLNVLWRIAFHQILEIIKPYDITYSPHPCFSTKLLKCHNTFFIKIRNIFRPQWFRWVIHADWT